MDSKIKKRRIELGLTLEQVGDICGVGKSTVRKWENGLINDIGRSKIVMLAQALQVSPLFILQEDEEAPLSRQEMKVLAYFNKLNDIGKKKALDNMKDLIQISSYNKGEVEQLNAAHEIKGATKEEQQHDEDIMDDDNF